MCVCECDQQQWIVYTDGAIAPELKVYVEYVQQQQKGNLYTLPAYIPLHLCEIFLDSYSILHSYIYKLETFRISIYLFTHVSMYLV